MDSLVSAKYVLTPKSLRTLALPETQPKMLLPFLVNCYCDTMTKGEATM